MAEDLGLNANSATDRAAGLTSPFHSDIRTTVYLTRSQIILEVDVLVQQKEIMFMNKSQPL